MPEKIQEILKLVRKEYEELYGDQIVKLVLFGSQARGDAEDSSDIDVLVVLKGNVNPSAEITRTSEINSDISLEYDTVISSVFVSENQYFKENSPLLMNIRKEGKAI